MFPDALGVLFDYRLRARRTALGVVVGVERGGASTEALNTTLLELNNELIGTRRELAGRNKRLAELDRLKDEFLATVTHDLKTPLTSIIGYAELLAETPNDGDLAAAAAATIVRNGGRLLEMVDELLLGAQIASGQYVPVLEPVRLDELAAAVVEASGPKAAEKSITITIDAATVEVQGDRGKLEQLLENLVSNAVKYTPAGGTVHVRVAPTDGVEVVDSGIGIAPDELPKVFERFFRAANGRNEATGTGIGLANAKAVAEAHGGRIVLTSELGSGSTFALELPLPG